jgi:hypothetical protein
VGTVLEPRPEIIGEDTNASTVYSRGGQLFWLGGHFVEAEVGGGPHLLK